MKNGHSTRRLWCLLLTLVLVVSVLPMAVFAEEAPPKLDFTEENYNMIVSIEKDSFSKNPEEFKQHWANNSNVHSYEDHMANVDRFLSDHYENNYTEAFRAWAKEFYAMVWGIELIEGPIIPHVHAWTPDYNRTIISSAAPPAAVSGSIRPDTTTTVRMATAPAAMSSWTTAA